MYFNYIYNRLVNQWPKLFIYRNNITHPNHFIISSASLMKSCPASKQLGDRIKKRLPDGTFLYLIVSYLAPRKGGMLPMFYTCRERLTSRLEYCCPRALFNYIAIVCWFTTSWTIPLLFLLTFNLSVHLLGFTYMEHILYFFNKKQYIYNSLKMIYLDCSFTCIKCFMNPFAH